MIYSPFLYCTYMRSWGVGFCNAGSAATAMARRSLLLIFFPLFPPHSTPSLLIISHSFPLLNPRAFSSHPIPSHHVIAPASTSSSSPTSSNSFKFFNLQVFVVPTSELPAIQGTRSSVTEKKKKNNSLRRRRGGGGGGGQKSEHQTLCV